MPMNAPHAPASSPTANDMRRAGRDALSLALMDVRNHTLKLLAHFEGAQDGGLDVPMCEDTELPLWLAGHITPGAVAIAVTLVQRLQGMSQWILWETSQFFENLGTDWVADQLELHGILRKEVERTVHAPPGAVQQTHIRVHMGLRNFNRQKSSGRRRLHDGGLMGGASSAGGA